jgi:hypothetical protein
MLDDGPNIPTSVQGRHCMSSQDRYDIAVVVRPAIVSSGLAVVGGRAVVIGASPRSIAAVEPTPSPGRASRAAA